MEEDRRKAAVLRLAVEGIERAAEVAALVVNNRRIGWSGLDGAANKGEDNETLGDVTYTNVSMGCKYYLYGQGKR